jgi:hypothetical protein
MARSLSGEAKSRCRLSMLNVRLISYNYLNVNEIRKLCPHGGMFNPLTSVYFDLHKAILMRRSAILGLPLQ